MIKGPNITNFNRSWLPAYETVSEPAQTLEHATIGRQIISKERQTWAMILNGLGGYNYMLLPSKHHSFSTSPDLRYMKLIIIARPRTMG